MKRLRVAAGILSDGAGRVLVSERLCDGPFDGFWEFPGGKIGTGESPADALCRELTEELGIRVLGSRHFMALSHRYPDRHVELDFFLVEHWSGEPAGLEGQRIRWVHVTELQHAELLPADAPVVQALNDQLRGESPAGPSPHRDVLSEE